MRRPRGDTLIELATALGVMAVLLAMLAGPVFQVRKRGWLTKLREETRQQVILGYIQTWEDE